VRARSPCFCQRTRGEGWREVDLVGRHGEAF
jgi:hypothetical protein